MGKRRILEMITIATRRIFCGQPQQLKAKYIRVIAISFKNQFCQNLSVREYLTIILWFNIEFLGTFPLIIKNQLENRCGRSKMHTSDCGIAHLRSCFIFFLFFKRKFKNSFPGNFLGLFFNSFKHFYSK